MEENKISIKNKILTLAEKSVSLRELQFNEKDSLFVSSSSLVNGFNNRKELFYPLSQSSWDKNEYNAIIDQLYTGNFTHAFSANDLYVNGISVTFNITS